jgi:hypothetical protein
MIGVDRNAGSALIRLTAVTGIRRRFHYRSRRRQGQRRDIDRSVRGRSVFIVNYATTPSRCLALMMTRGSASLAIVWNGRHGGRHLP